MKTWSTEYVSRCYVPLSSINEKTQYSLESNVSWSGEMGMIKYNKRPSNLLQSFLEIILKKKAAKVCHFFRREVSDVLNKNTSSKE